MLRIDEEYRRVHKNKGVSNGDIEFYAPSDMDFDD